MRTTRLGPNVPLPWRFVAWIRIRYALPGARPRITAPRREPATTRTAPTLAPAPVITLIRYAVILAPPSFTGAFHLSRTDVSRGVTSVRAGPTGGRPAGSAVTSADQAPAPALFSARTRKP